MAEESATTRPDPAEQTITERAVAVVRPVFGDTTGAAVFFGALCLFGVLGRLDVLLNDSATVLNVLANLEDGRLALETRSFGTEGVSPGMVTVDGQVYGRNYGQAVFALPFLFALRAFSVVLSPRLTLVVWWVAATGLFLLALRRATGRRRLAGYGAGLAAVLVGASLLRDPWTPVQVVPAALVVSNFVVGAACCLLVYRLVAEVRGRRVGGLAAGTAMLATPVGLWALWPKRHVLTATLVLGSLYAFSHSRSIGHAFSPTGRAGNYRRYLVARAGAYACVGLLAWVHAAEAITLFLPLALVDLATAPRNDARTLAAVAGAFALSLAPALVTNTLVAGNPLEAPRLLDAYGGQVPAGGADAAGGSGGGGGAGTSGSGLLRYPGLVLGQYASGVLALADVGRLARLVAWSGPVESPSAVAPLYPGTNLSFYEAAPVLGALGTAVGAAAGRLRRAGRMGAVAPTTGFGLAVAVSFVLLYLPRLPLNSQITVRYLFPLFPLGVVLLFRGTAIGDVVDEGLGAAGVAYLLAVVAVFTGVVGSSYVDGFGVAEAFLLHAAVNVTLGVAFLLLAALSSYTNRYGRATAVAYGVTAGAGTAFVLAVTLVYFHYGPSVLPSMELLTRRLWTAVVI